MSILQKLQVSLDYATLRLTYGESRDIILDKITQTHGAAVAQMVRNILNRM